MPDDDRRGVPGDRGFDTLSELRDDTAEQVRRIKHNQQLVEARDKLMELLLERTGVPAPEGVVRDEVNHRKQHLVEDLERMGRALEEYLSLENKTEEELDQELTEAVSRGVRNQLVLDAVADAEEVQVSDEEFGQEIVMRAQQVGMADVIETPQSAGGLSLLCPRKAPQ